MFKIESYITPIIINYIDKYVKDFRPQNAQVSLWGGEVSFQNLDIRLDVLQQELNLPLSIVSGHIHELTIRIPWTKIASEPIQINVNTIEFVVKLKSEETTKKEKENEKLVKAPIIQEPPGYMATLINKIANNISIKLNNIIFKYIEDDIVFSMNIQLLSIDSADNNWNPAFIDINPSKVILKKVINISDLTICLDKRNAQGKIDVCQEPILYRCSLQARMIRKYNLSTAHISSTTRIDLFTDYIDFKVSAQQYPMLIRIYLLIQMLKEQRMSVYINQKKNSEGYGGADSVISDADASYISWMWNMLPEFFPKDEEEDSAEPHGHIYHTGFYAKKVNITLKSQEIVSSSIIQSTTTLKYHPFLKISLYGLYFDAVSVGRMWYNLKGGISYIGLFPVGNCTCGKKHNFPTVFLSGKKVKDDKNLFLSDSLKDNNACENQDQFRMYETDFERHLASCTQEELLKKTPALAIDIVSHREFLDETKTYSANSLSNADLNTMSEEYYLRVIFGDFNFKLDSTLLHLTQTLNEHYEQYVYTAPYVKPKIEDSLSHLTPPSTEDYDSLLECVPLRKYNFYFNRPQIEVYYTDSDHIQSLSSNDFHRLPYLFISLNRVEVNMTSPLYPDKLVHTTCQLPNPPEALRTHCFHKTKVTAKNTTVNVMLRENNSFLAFTITNLKFNNDVLLKPDFWKLIQLPNSTYDLNVAELTVCLNKPQLILLLLLYETYATRNYNSLIKTITNVNFVDIVDWNLPVLDVHFNQLQLFTMIIDKTVGIDAHLRSICGYAFIPNHLKTTSKENFYKFKTIFLSNEHLTADILKCTVQFSLDLKALKYPPILTIILGKAILNADLLFQAFLNYNILWERKQIDSSQSFTLEEKSFPRKQLIRKTSKVRSFHRTESVHSNSMMTLSAVNSSVKAKEKDKLRYIKWYEIIKCLIIHIDFKTFTIVCPNKSLFMQQEAANINNILIDSRHLLLTRFRLPNLTIESSKFKHFCTATNNTFPITANESTWSATQSGFPWTVAMNDFGCDVIENNVETIFLAPVHTKVTLDLIDKSKSIEFGGEEMSFVIHMDTTPIELNLWPRPMQHVYNSIQLLTSCMLLSSETSKENPVYALEHPPQMYDFQINDFIGEATNSEVSSEDVMPTNDVSSNKFTFLIQWTITKFGIILFGSNQQSDIRIIFELEDLITSIDKQKTYLKAKTKIGSLNGLRERGLSSSGNVDKLSIISRSDALTDNSQETFFELVATKAITNNVHNKWGAKKTIFAGGNENDTITEIMVTMQSVDLKLELDVLYVITSILNAVDQNKQQTDCNKTTNIRKPSAILSVKALPLIFFNCKGLQLWIPTLTSSSLSDVFIFKVNAISITPTVENPIRRKPLREDIYSKAEQLRVINTPGSEVEDRQYELLIKDLSMGTGNWKEILNYTQQTNVKSELLIENPAFEWNNQTQKPSLNVNTIFKDVVISVIYAPAILFHNILVCGQAIEINCVNDLFLKISLDDVKLLNNLYLDFIDTFNVNRMNTCQNQNHIDTSLLIDKRFRKHKRSSYMKSASFDTESSDNQWSDSGFKSDSKKNDIKASTKAGVSDAVVPFVLTFIGGLFGIKLYRSSISADNDDVETEPLISTRIMQPNLYISREPLGSVQQISVYNVTISLYDLARFKDTAEEFGDTIFDTNLGDLDTLGVPPPLLKLQKTFDIATNELKLKCDILKPMKIRVTSDNIGKILNLKKLIDSTLTSNKNLMQEEHKPMRIVRYKKIKVIKQMFSDAKHIDFSMTNTIINCITSKNCSLNLSFLYAKCKLGFYEHPERLTFDSTLNSLVINTEHSIILHPLTVDFNCTLTQEKWNRKLSTTANFKSNIINFQICPNDVQTIAKVKVDFLNCINEYTKNTLYQNNDKCKNNKLNDIQFNFNEKNLIPLYASHQKEAHRSATVEHFQDDLRLGTFQYITTSGAEALPLPYQIFLETEDDNWEICWRYPHPRVLNNLQIYPLPKQSNSDITCYLEYYQESHNIFFPFCTFKLDNRELHEITLPKRKVSASVWRIKIIRPLTFLDDLENEEERGFYDIIGPKDIIGCIRIDSLFSVKHIPLVQTNINISDLSVTILNNFHVPNLKMPDVLKQYTLHVGDHLNNTQEFCRLYSPKINASFSIYTEMDVTMYNEFQFGIDIFDYSYLTMQPLLENVTVKSYVEVAMNSLDERDNVCYIIINKLNIKYGSTAGHAIATAKQIWQNILKADESEYNLPIVTRYVICNSISVPFKFGQDETDEQIWLRSNYCFYYAFRNQNLSQRLKFTLDTEDACAICDFDDLNELNYLPINQEKLLLVTTKKISTTQRQVIVKGQIEILNMTKETFQVHYKSNVQSDEDTKLSSQCVILLPADSTGSFFAKCDESSNHVLRLHLDGANGNGWSGEIPLHTYLTHVPWLVKVPTKASQKYTSYSVRIHRENIENLKEINGKPLRILIVIWPLFIARSMLPMDLIATDTEFEKNYVLSGRGQCEDLHIAGTYDTEHEFLFDLGSNPCNGNDIWKTILSFKGIDKRTFFTIPDRYKCINDILKELEKPVELKWPCSKGNELTMARQTNKGFRSAMPLYKFTASRELSCSLLLDVLPWCLFINAMGVDIKITNSAENVSCPIESNHIAVPVMITTAFNIEMKFGNEWCSSCLIYINECKPVHKSKSYVKLPENGQVLLEVWSTNGFSKLLLTSSIENSTRIISLLPLAVLCNFSKNPLKYFVFCLAQNEKQDYDWIAKSVKDNLYLTEMPGNKMEETYLFKGQGITRFVNLSEKNIAANNQKNMNYYLIIGTDDDKLSTPILLNKPMIRHAFGLSSVNGEISLALSVMEYNGQFFISVCNDHYPLIEVDNQTNVSLIVAEAEYADYSKTSKPKRSRHFDNFQWFCSIDAHRKISYTPPSVNENFPDKPISNYNLIFACTSKLTKGVSIQWSVPIDISKIGKKFMALPLHGDVKLSINRINKTIKILVENIDFKTEFNVKNVRTKLSSPHKEITQHQNVIDDKEGTTYDNIEITHDKLNETKLAKAPLFQLNANIYIKDIAITLYDEDKQALHRKNEIVSLYVDNVFIDYLAEKRSIEFGCGNIQVDNKLYSSGKYDFPVILCGQENNNTTTNAQADERSNGEKYPLNKSDENSTINAVDTKTSNFNDLLPFSLHQIKLKHMQNPLLFIKIILENSIFSPDEIHCTFKPFRVYVEDKFIAVLIDFMIENLPANIIYAANASKERVVCESGQIILPRVITEQILILVSEPVRIRYISIKPLSVLLSVHTCMRMYIALDHSPLHFAQFESKNVYTTTMRLGYNIGMHYVSGAIFGAGWVVGSLEILGSPSGLARSVTTGLWDFVSMPVQGLFRGPWGFLLGLTHGSASLLKNVTAGTVNSVTKLAASVARNLDRLTLDDEHLERTEALRRSRPQGITHGFTQGLTGFGISLLGAVGGIARHALEAKSSVEVFTGLGKGLVGVVTKPISGAAELLALTGQGVLHTVGFNTLPTSRSATIQRPYVCQLSVTKIIWKILTKISYPDQVLFVSLGKLIKESQSEDITIVITTKLILFISFETIEPIEVLSLSNITAAQNEENPCMVYLCQNEDIETYRESQFHYNRILQYVSNSREQSAMKKMDIGNEPPNIGNKSSNQKIISFNESNLARYFVNYVQLIKHSLNQ